MFQSLKVKVLVAQLCLTLCDPMDCSPPGSSVMEFSRQEYWSGLPFPSPGDLPDLGIKPGSRIERGSPALQADALPSKPPGISRYDHSHLYFQGNYIICYSNM